MIGAVRQGLHAGKIAGIPTHAEICNALSSAVIRLLMADGTTASRSAARAMLRSSHTAINMRSVVGSNSRFIACIEERCSALLCHVDPERSQGEGPQY